MTLAVATIYTMHRLIYSYPKIERQVGNLEMRFVKNAKPSLETLFYFGDYCIPSGND